MYFKIGFLLIVFMFYHVGQAFQILEECSKKGSKIENTLRSIIFVTDEFQNFNSQKDMIPYCDAVNNLYKDAVKFKKTPQCMNPVSFQALSTILPKFKSFYKTRCSSKIDDTFQIVKCVTEKNKQPIRKCFNEYAKVIQYTAKKVQDPNKQLSLLCCNYHKVQKCLNSGEFLDCGAVKSSKFASDVLKQLLDDLMNLMCFKYDSPTCQAEGLTQEIENIRYKVNSNEF